MTAIDPKASARYWARLFGYVLVLAVIGGGFTGGGIYLLDEAEAFPGGPGVDIGTELAAGGVLTAVGSLLLLAGFFTIVLNVVADGVRAGVEAANAAPTTATGGDDETADEPATDDVETKEFVPGESASAPQADSDQQHVVSSQPRARTEDDEAWKREVERKLETEDERATGDRAARRPAETTATDANRAPTEDQPAANERPDATDTAARRAPTETGRDIDDSPAEDQVPNQSAEETPGTETTGDSEEVAGESAEEWVSAEEVRGGQSAEENSPQPAGHGDESAGESLPDEPAETDDPQKPRDASDLFGTETTEETETDDESSDDPLAPDDIEPQADTASDPLSDVDDKENEDDEDGRDPQ